MIPLSSIIEVTSLMHCKQLTMIYFNRCNKQNTKESVQQHTGKVGVRGGVVCWDNVSVVSSVANNPSLLFSISTYK